jgi:hypothetical protein
MKSKLSALCVAALAVTVTGLAQPATPTGYIKVNEFLDITGVFVTDLTGNPKFPNSPDIVSYAGYFEWPQATSANINDMPPSGIRDNYGVQIIGYLHPQTSGNYTFWISADDQGELWLSTDATAANKRLIAREPEWNNARDYAGVAEANATTRRTVDGVVVNRSAPIALVAGQAYYIEALMKEGGGGDNLSVTWSSTGTLPSPALPIAGQFLSPIDYTTPPPAPVILTQPADVRVAIAGQPLTFTVVPNGPWNIQWTKTVGATTSDIPGATGRLYTFNPTAADAGSSYAARVSNATGTVTSRSALLQEVDPVVADQLTRGFLKVEHYGGIGGTAVLPFYNDPRYATRNYDFMLYVAGANVPQTSPDLNDFARIVSGWVQPPTTGQWRFFIRSDDASELHVDVGVTHPNMIDDPHNRLPIAEETACCAAFQAPGNPRTSAAIPLNAANRYSLVAIYKEGGGGDWMQIAWREEADTTAPAQLQPIAPGHVWTMANPSGRRYDITRQPTAQTVVEARTATFEVAVSAYPAGSPFGVQWTRNGADIPGATGMSYTTPILTVADNGATYTAKFYTLRGELLSDSATLTVLPDTFPPTPSAGALVSRDGTTVDVGVGFDEAVTDATASVQANYTVTGGTVQSFTYYPLSQSALIKVTGLAPGASGTVTVRNVADIKGNAIPAAGVEVPFTVSENLRWNIVGAPDQIDLNATTPPVPLAGNYVVPVADDAFDIFSNGRGQWNNYDESVFVYEQVTGDFDKKVRVEFQENSSQWARAGLIMKEATNFGDNLEAQAGTQPYGNAGVAPFDGNASRYQKVHVNPVGPTLTGPPPGNAGNGAWEGNRRLATGGPSSSAGGGGVPLYPNAWSRIQRSGNTFTIYRSDDGMNWVQMGATTFDPPMPQTVYVGPDYTPEVGNINNLADRRSFLAKIRDYGDTFAAGPPALASEVLANGDIRVTFEGTLQQRAAGGGDWTPAGVTSPATITPSGTGTLYRAVQ